MSRKRTYPKITVKVPAHPDKNCAGQAQCRKPGATFACFTEAPEEVEATPQIRRLIALGSLVVTDEAPVAEDSRRRPALGRDPKKDFEENVLNK